MSSDQKTSIDYFAGFRFLFQDSNWGMNLLMGALFTLIPIVGPIVLLGWYCEVFQRLVQKNPNPRPKIDFNDFVHYLGRGIGPFVVALIITLPIVLIMMVLMFAFIFGSALLFGQQHNVDNPVLPFMMVGTGFVVFFLFMLPMVTLSNAGLTRAYLMEDIGGALDLRRIYTYAKATWKNVLLAYLVYFPVSLLAAVVGMLALYVGIFAVSFILNLAWVYMAWQIYEVYLAEGGEAIPIKTPRALLPSETPRAPAPPPVAKPPAQT